MKYLFYRFPVWLLMFILAGCVSSTDDDANEIKVTGQTISLKACEEARRLNPEDPC